MEEEMLLLNPRCVKNQYLLANLLVASEPVCKAALCDLRSMKQPCTDFKGKVTIAKPCKN